jgi:hypothetical protein
VRSDDDASLILVPLGIKLTLELELLRPALVARFTGPAIMAALVSESDARNSFKSENSRAICKRPLSVHRKLLATRT